jgi:signal transduction histidine kinase/ligand-binding sensor domain-containing protein
MRRHICNSRWLMCVTLVSGFVVVGMCVSAAPSARQETDFHHTGWSGLGAVFDLKQSSDGYLWLTTSKGVFRFDGVRFQSIEEVTRGSVHNNDVDSVFVSRSNGLWLTTEGAGLLFWKGGHLTSFPDRRCTPIRKQGQVIEDHDGSLWVQATAGLFHFRGSVCEQLGAEEGYPGGFPAGLLMDSDGTLWVKTRVGPLLFLPQGQTKFQASKVEAWPSTGFAYLHEAPDGGIWISDNKGLRCVTDKLSASAKPALRSFGNHARYGDFAFAPDGSLWAVTDKGVQRFDQGDSQARTTTARSEIFAPEQGLISSDAVWKLLVDREGGVWVGTNSGLDWLRRVALTTVRLPHAQEREYGIAPGEDGSVWTGNNDLPLTRIASDGRITSFPLTPQTVTIRRDHNGTIWFASAFGLWQSSSGGFTPVHYPEENLAEVVFVATDRNNHPWITTTTGRAYEFSGGKWNDETETLGKKPGIIGAMVDDQAGNVWFAFSNKVVRWDGSAFYRFSFPDGQRGVNENTMSVREDHVWLGGAGGVQLLTRGKFYLMRWKDGDLPGRISGVVETQTGDLWLNGFSGITHVSASELRTWLKDPNSAITGDHLDELDGLPGLSGETVPDPSVAQASDGRLWFATTKGIAWLDPATFERNRNRVPPPVAISTLISNGKPYADSDAIRLPARNENLEIDYTALSLVIPERVLFRYKLDGVDENWQDAGTRREAYYTKLRPGQYRFHVIACNNDGVWNEAGASLDFTVLPAWYQTNWFRILCLACCVFLVSTLYRLRMRQVAASINARFDERLAERTRIAQELHDTLLQGFLSASMQVHVAVDRLSSNSDARPILIRALQVMSKVIEEGRNAVQGLRLTDVSLDLEHAFVSVQQEFQSGGSEGKQVEFHILTEGQPRPLHPLLRDEIYRIGREALTNAFRHARATRIDLELNYGSNQFRLTVLDNGCGIEHDILLKGRRGHWGLSGMRERADRIGASLHLFSRVSGGTEVKLTVPGPIAFQDEPRGIAQWIRKHRYFAKLVKSLSNHNIRLPEAISEKRGEE